ncbi:ROK family protein [Salsuginibacillus kocurii]|uniref:ROK family protein n=1 Tax=Salsuginibacillus kocurii TaxID=427078 RepID=UPI00037B0B87|nr:ROK family protein [Salsuginibacillus kocurii]
MVYGAIEAGGTKFVCSVANPDTFDIMDSVTIPTTTPPETMKEVFAFFDQFSLRSIGIGSFGPIDVNTSSDTYGYITSTPKPNWGNYPLRQDVAERYNVPVAWTTDVNAAAYGEYHKGSGKGLNSCLYLTVGTGVGGGAIIDGRILEGHGHPEMGHIMVQKHPDDKYEGACPYHSNCLEGLAAGPAIEARYGAKAQTLADKEEVWRLEAHYLAQALVSYTLVLRPERIILGGGVMQQPHLLPLIHEEFKTFMGGYVPTDDLESYIVTPGLEGRSGIVGCLLLAKEAEAESH